ncbi:MAG: type VI secretion system contractile sheath domain-containing protein, partial [Longimicrobiales bacterium]
MVPRQPSGDGFDRADVRLDVGLGAETHPRERPADATFEIALFGNFSGRTSALSASDAPAPRAVQVDRDDLNDVLEGMRPTLNLQWDDFPTSVPISFDSIWDFEPQELYERLPIFRALEQRVGQGPIRPASAGAEAPALDPSANLMEQVLSASGSEPAKSAKPVTDLQDFIDQALAPYLVRENTEELARGRAVEAAVSTLLRRVLHDPAFQALEGLWRSVDFLCRALETGVGLKIHLVDMTKAELAENLLGAEDLLETPVGRMMVNSSQGGAGRFSLAAACYGFGPDDLPLLDTLARLGQLVNTPWLGEGDPTLAGLALT